MPDHFPVIVIGGGTMGTAAAWALGKHGVPALVLEQFGHVHTFGAHSGRTRIFRHAYAESPDYVPLVLRADELWQELEVVSGQRVLVRTGGLDLAAPGFDHAAAAHASCAQWNLPAEWLTGAEVRQRWPGYAIPDDWDASFSSQAGYLKVEPALRTLAAAARALGVTINEHEPVLTWRADGDGFVVETSTATYLADHVIVTAGPWAGRMLADLGLPLTILRKTLFWFAADAPERFTTDRFPIFIAESDAGSIYGFPIGDEAGVKVANHSGGDQVDLATVDRTVKPGEEAEVARWVESYLSGVTSRVVDSAACLYTMTPDTDFIVDHHPNNQRIAIGAGFSGHGFKFTPAIGEVLANLVLDSNSTTLPRLSLSRFSTAPVG